MYAIRMLVAVFLPTAVLLTLASPATAHAEPAPTVAFLGDSYTQGDGASVPATRWTSEVARTLGWTEHNFGNGGTGYVTVSAETGRPPYRVVLPEVVAADPDIVVVAGGQNDLRPGVDPAALRDAVTATFATLRADLPRARIIAVGPSVPWPVGNDVITLDRDVQAAAVSVGATYVSLLSPTPVVQPWMVLPDDLHVGDPGHKAIADRVIGSVTR